MPPAPGGGGVYTQLLVNGLLNLGLVEFAAVLTEMHPNQPDVEFLCNGHLKIIRHFPFRAGVASKNFARYFQYLFQNLQFLGIVLHVKRMGITHLLIHSSFHNHPNLMWLSIKLVRFFAPSVKQILDVRDPKLPLSRFEEVYIYQKVICCSENVMQHFSGDSSLTNKLVHIPIIIDLNKPTEQEIADCKRKYGLDRLGYVFNGSGISKEKGTDRVFEAVRELRKKMPDICLVVAGRKRDWLTKYDVAEESGCLRYVGVVPHRDILCLSAGALVDVNLSHVDSMPRASLEAMVSGGRVLLPRGVPEFDRDCPEYVAVSDDAESVAEQLYKIILNNFSVKYDVTPHSPWQVLHAYGELFRNVF